MPRDSRSGLEIFGPVNELAGDALYRCTLVKNKGADDEAPLTDVTAITLTVSDYLTNHLIGEKRRNVLNTGGGVLNATTGEFSFEFTSTDNIILEQRRDYEDHVALFEYTHSSGKQGNHAIIVRVRNLRRVGGASE